MGTSDLSPLHTNNTKIRWAVVEIRCVQCFWDERPTMLLNMRPHMSFKFIYPHQIQLGNFGVSLTTPEDDFMVTIVGKVRKGRGRTLFGGFHPHLKKFIRCFFQNKGRHRCINKNLHSRSSLAYIIFQSGSPGFSDAFCRRDIDRTSTKNTPGDWRNYSARIFNLRERCRFARFQYYNKEITSHLL